MWNYVAIYFIVNFIIATILWLYSKPKHTSAVGYFLMMGLFGLFLIGVLFVAVIIVVLGGASYNFGDALESTLRDYLP